MGYRRYGAYFLQCHHLAHSVGLKFEDLIVESDDVGKAYARLPKEVLSGMSPDDWFAVVHRSFSDHDDRVKQAFILHSGGKILPKEQWTTEETDTTYLSRYLEQVLIDW